MESFNTRKRRQELDKARAARSRAAGFRMLRTVTFTAAGVSFLTLLVSALIGLLPPEGAVGLTFAVIFVVVFPGVALNIWVMEHFRSDIHYKHAVEDAEAAYMDALNKDLGGLV